MFYYSFFLLFSVALVLHEIPCPLQGCSFLGEVNPPSPSTHQFSVVIIQGWNFTEIFLFRVNLSTDTGIFSVLLIQQFIGQKVLQQNSCCFGFQQFSTPSAEMFPHLQTQQLNTDVFLRARPYHLNLSACGQLCFPVIVSLCYKGRLFILMSGSTFIFLLQKNLELRKEGAGLPKFQQDVLFQNP